MIINTVTQCHIELICFKFVSVFCALDENRSRSHILLSSPVGKPATVTKHQCTSDGFNDLVCEFYTNSSKYDLMDWEVQWSTE